LRKERDFKDNEKRESLEEQLKQAKEEGQRLKVEGQRLKDEGQRLAVAGQEHERAHQSSKVRLNRLMRALPCSLA
jgi:hypothetical protein